jgi:hypothetical protein
MKVHQKLKGLVEYNDGQFAEVQTNGTEGLEKNLLLETIQIHREDTFQPRFPVGRWLDIRTTTEFTAKAAR